MRRIFVIGIFVLSSAVAAPTAAWAGSPGNTGKPSGTGLPSQSCQDIVAAGGTEPGHASSSPGSPFNEPTKTTPGGTGGQH